MYTCFIQIRRAILRRYIYLFIFATSSVNKRWIQEQNFGFGRLRSGNLYSDSGACFRIKIKHMAVGNDYCTKYSLYIFLKKRQTIVDEQ